MLKKHQSLTLLFLLSIFTTTLTISCSSDSDDTIEEVVSNDTDNDGQTDVDEIACGSNPNDSTSTSPDNDSDNIPNCVDPDDDDDGQSDNVDTDDDGDGQSDEDEMACGSDPNDSTSTSPDADGDNTPDCVDTDDDNDGQSDEDEIACGSDPNDNTSTSPDVDGDGIPDCVDTDNNTTPPIIDRNSLATNGCQNVIIVNGYAYAACGNELEVISLTTLQRNLLTISADDITADPDAGLIFTLSRNLVTVLDINNPMSPTTITTTNTNFSAFSGISAANGVLVVSAGAGGSNTQIFTYTNNTISLATDGNATIDNVTGNPDVHVTATPTGITAFYSQDIGQVANWAIQIAEINTNGQVVNTPPFIRLTAGQFTGGPFGPSNFPVESEFLNNRLYIANFAAQGIEIIDLDNNNQLLSPIGLSYDPTNITTDGTLLFVVGASNDTVDVIDPSTDTIIDSIDAALPQPTGASASATHIAIADRTDGLVVITRQ